VLQRSIRQITWNIAF